jgi:hypothetical protein
MLEAAAVGTTQKKSNRVRRALSMNPSEKQKKKADSELDRK